MPAFIDLTGHIYGRLTVLKRSERKDNKVRWTCRCECGNSLDVIAGLLRCGNTKSCGCQRVDSSKQNGLKRRIHGMTGSPEYKAWQSMKDRCHNPDAAQYDNYGGRGIQVCNEWMISFQAFYRAMGSRPGHGYSVDRIDVNGNYEPGNCRWATSEEQGNNKRLNVKFTLDGEELTLPQISRKYNIPISTLVSRIYRDKLSIVDAISKKVHQRFAHYKGVSKRLNEWADELGIPYLKIYRHVMTVSPDLKELIGI